MWGYKLAVSTIAEILRRHGIEPAPERSRKTSWKEFLAQHWGLIVAADFFSVEVWTWTGLKRFLVLFLHRSEDTAGGDRRHQFCCQWALDEPGRQKCDRRGGWNLVRQTLCDSRS